MKCSDMETISSGFYRSVCEPLAHGNQPKSASMHRMWVRRTAHSHKSQFYKSWAMSMSIYDIKCTTRENHIPIENCFSISASVTVVCWLRSMCCALPGQRYCENNFTALFTWNSYIFYVCVWGWYGIIFEYIYYSIFLFSWQNSLSKFLLCHIWCRPHRIPFVHSFVCFCLFICSVVWMWTAIKGSTWQSTEEAIRQIQFSFRFCKFGENLIETSTFRRMGRRQSTWAL